MKKLMVLSGVFLGTCLAINVVGATNIEESKKGTVKIVAEVEGNRKIGTGIIVQVGVSECFIVTARHVIVGDPSPGVFFLSTPNRAVSSETIKMQEETDLALIRVNQPCPQDVKPLSLDSDVQLSGGEAFNIIGFPRTSGTPWAVTQAVHSGYNGSLMTFSGVADEGNSGGPLLAQGKVVGLVTQMFNNIGHAVPAATVRLALQNWINYKPSVKLIVDIWAESGKPYEIVPNGLRLGEKGFIDRDYEFTRIPETLKGSTYIMTAMNDKFERQANFLEFSVTKPVTVYVVHDVRYKEKPRWMSTFEDTGLVLVYGGATSATKNILYKKVFLAGKVTLGGNYPPQDAGNNGMYFVIVKD